MSRPVTAIIVLLLPVMNHGNPLDSAIDRWLEVAVGALTGLAVSFMVLPSSARTARSGSMARASCSSCWRLPSLNCCRGLTRGVDSNTLHQLQDGIGSALVGLNAVGAEAETRARAAKLSSGTRPGRCLRTILRRCAMIS